MRSGPANARQECSATNSSRSASAQCRSSSTRISGLRAATASKNRRQAVKVSDSGSRRADRGPPARPASGARWASTQRASWAGRDSRPSTAIRQLLLTVAGRHGCQHAGVALDDLGQRPEADAVAVGAGSGPVARRSSPARCSTRWNSSQTSRDLPIPGGPSVSRAGPAAQAIASSSRSPAAAARARADQGAVVLRRGRGRCGRAA